MNAPAGKFKAKIIGVCPIKKKEITDGLAQIDAGASKERLIKMLNYWHGKDFDDYVLITLWAQ
ncbi:MAG: hypothetical protein KAX11_07150 [Candidatus Aminicenantes bacterium]|nr:hypothetical protein [Candidatus Aminicenantes bacterium]